MNESELQDLMNDISTEVAGGRIDHALVLALKHGHRPTFFLLRKAWAGLKVTHRWILREYIDLNVWAIWTAFGICAVAYYHGRPEPEPLAVQLALVLPFLGFVALVATDRVRRVKMWWQNYRATISA